jgi:hypothetical protein
MRDADIQISSLTFTDEGVQISYMVLPTDVRDNGMVVQRALLIASTADTAADIRDLHDTAREALVSWVEDFDESEPYEPQPDDDDDDDRGMGE